jgi:hypothetical protein
VSASSALTSFLVGSGRSSHDEPLRAKGLSWVLATHGRRCRGALLAVEPSVAVEEFSVGALGPPGLDLEREWLDAVKFGPVPGDR